MSVLCSHCGGDLDIRNPKGHCDHLYYPEYCDVCAEINKGHVRTIFNMVKDAHTTAIEKGWWETDRNNYELLCLVHGEVSEAMESLRKGDNQHVVEELADVLIRIFDLCGARSWDLETAVLRKMEFNKTRPYRHGGKLA